MVRLAFAGSHVSRLAGFQQEKSLTYGMKHSAMRIEAVLLSLLSRPPQRVHTGGCPTAWFT